MSAYQQNTNTNQLNQQYPNMKLNQPSELNENHGIAATGLNDPHYATAPYVQGNAGSRGQRDESKYSSGPALSGNKFNRMGNNSMPGGFDNSRQENTLSQTNSMPSGTTYTGPPVGDNTFNQSGTNTMGANTTLGDHVNSHHEGLRATDNLNKSGAGFNSQLGRDIYGSNTNELSTHQPKNDVINSNTPGTTDLRYSGADTDIRNVDQSGGFDSNIHGNKYSTGTAGISGVSGDLDRNNGSRTSYVRASGIPGSTDTSVHSSSDNNNTHRHAGTGIPPTEIVHDAKHDVDHTNYKNMTAPEGDHGASHHMKEHGNFNENAGRFNELNTDSGIDRNINTYAVNDPKSVPGIVDDKGMRHAGEPLHEGLGKAIPENERRKYDAEHLGHEKHLDSKHGLATNTSTTTGEHPVSSDGVEKPSVGDKIKGNLEKMAGKITGNEAKVIKGENIAHGRQ